MGNKGITAAPTYAIPDNVKVYFRPRASSSKIDQSLITF